MPATKTKPTKPAARPAKAPAALPDVIPDAWADAFPVALLAEHPDNPRKTFDPGELEKLAASVREHGIDQRLVVRLVGTPGGPELEHNPDGWRHVTLVQVLDGHRRLRAAKLAGRDAVPVECVVCDDREAYAYMVRAFAQRSDPPVSEQVAAYGKLAADGQTAEQIVALTGETLGFVRSVLRLAKLPAWALAAVDRGVLPRATAELVARVPGAEARARAAACVLLGCRRPGDLDADWNDGDTWEEAAGRVGTGGVATDDALSFRDTRELIRTHFTRELKTAPFSRKALYVLEGAELPRCEGCPSLAANNDEAKADGVRGDVCLDTDCYRRKAEAYRQTETAKAAKKGVQSAPEEFDWPLGFGDQRPPKGWCLLDADVPATELAAEFPPGKVPLLGLAAVLGNDCPQQHLAFGRDGKPRLLVRTAEARKVLQAGGVIPKPEPRKREKPPAGAGARTEGKSWEGVPTADADEKPTLIKKAQIAERGAAIAARVLAEYGASECEAVGGIPDASDGGPIHGAIRFITRFLVRDHCEFGDERADAVRVAFGITSDGRIAPTSGAFPRALAVVKAAEDRLASMSAADAIGACLCMVLYPLLVEDHEHYKPLVDELLDWAELDRSQLQDQARRELAGGESAEAKVERALAEKEVAGGCTEVPAEALAVKDSPPPPAADVCLADIDGIPDAVADLLEGQGVTTADQFRAAVERETAVLADLPLRNRLVTYLVTLGAKRGPAGHAADVLAKHLDGGKESEA